MQRTALVECQSDTVRWTDGPVALSHASAGRGKVATSPAAAIVATAPLWARAKYASPRCSVASKRPEARSPANGSGRAGG
eukprot:9804799-Alexandrium_andersonii.AAC.1